MTDAETSRHYPGPRWASVWLAAVAAGPAFLIGLVLDDCMRRPAGIAGAISGLSYSTGLLPVAIAAGAIIAFPCAALGASILFYLGMANVIARHPVVWGLACAASAGIVMLTLTAGWVILPIPFAFTGAVVASICRWRSSWAA